MRFVTWNCRVGAFRNKAKHIAPLRPDVLVAQEVEPIDSVLLFAGEQQPTYRDRCCDPESPRRAIGVFSYTDTTLRAVDQSETLYGFRRYEAQRGDLMFQVVGVWTAVTKSRATSYMQAHDGIRRHEDWIAQRPTVIVGDFNDNASYRTAHWQELLNLLEPLGLQSAYHTYFDEPYGAETRPTHFHRGQKTSAFHLDYCFLPKPWAERIKGVDVGTFEDWGTISDHGPLTVDVDV
jgi:exonuclease III